MYRIGCYLFAYFALQVKKLSPSLQLAWLQVSVALCVASALLLSLNIHNFRGMLFLICQV
jgi:hypothetical protein